VEVKVARYQIGGNLGGVVLTILRHLNFHRFDQIKVARYQIGGN
jgi:hypothetical protein